MTAAPTTMASFFPSLDRKVLIALALSGVAATIAFDVFGQILSPAAGCVSLAPVGLAKIVIAKLFGVSTTGGAFVLHYLTGLLFYPLGYLFAARPVASAVAPRMPWWAVGTIAFSGFRVAWFYFATEPAKPPDAQVGNDRPSVSYPCFRHHRAVNTYGTTWTQHRERPHGPAV